MARTGQPAVRHVAAVERAFAVLDALADGDELGTNEIARRTGINASTVSRLLATLASARFVEHVPESGRYRLSLRLIELGNAVLVRLDLRTLARPHLQALVRETGETATLSVPGEHDAITVDFEHGSSVGPERRPARAAERRSRNGGRQGDARLRRGRSTGAAVRILHAAHDHERERLAEELARVRLSGFAEAREERELGLAAVAAPVRGGNGELAGIVGLQGPSSRFDPAGGENRCHRAARPHRDPVGRAGLARAARSRTRQRDVMRRLSRPGRACVGRIAP